MTIPADLILITAKVVKRRVIAAHSKMDHDLVHLFLELQEGFSPTMSLFPENVRDLWERYRKDPKLVKFLLDGASEVMFLSGLNGDQWNVMAGDLAAALSVRNFGFRQRQHDAKETCVVDSAILDRLSSTDEAKQLLIDNKWYVFIILMSLCPKIYRMQLDGSEYEAAMEQSDDTKQ